MVDEEEKKEQPIIIVKKKGGHGGHHGGAWKVAYADFVTAMMAFFLVMWLVSQSDQVKEAVAGYFNDPANYGKMKGTGVLEGTPTPKTPPINIKNQKQSELTLLRKAAKNIKRTMERNPDLSELQSQVEMSITSRGLRIQLVEKGETKTFFKIGSPKPNKDAEEVLSIIGKELAKLPNEIVIEGHTDSRRYTRDDYTNWELSTERANAARYLLVQNGVDYDKIFSVEGYADRFLKIPEDPYDYRNRRVAILVLIKSESNKYVKYEVGDLID